MGLRFKPYFIQKEEEEKETTCLSKTGSQEGMNKEIESKRANRGRKRQNEARERGRERKSCAVEREQRERQRVALQRDREIAKREKELRGYFDDVGV
ncbi:unnamed protein product [Prunus armeniaca]